MIRLFVALKIPLEIRQKITEIRKKIATPEVDFRWEKEDKLHLTLKFIGEVEEELLDQIKNEIKFIEGFESFSCHLTKFGFFKKNGKPKILWVGLDLDHSIIDLVNKLNEKLKIFGIPVENRNFKAHLTLLRIKNYFDKNLMNSFYNLQLPEINFTADEVVLYKSELLKSGSVYKEINKYKLKNTEAK